MKAEAPFQDFPAYAEKSTNKKPFVILLVILVVIAAGVGGLYYLGSNKKSDSQAAIAPTKIPTPTEKPTETPTSSPSGSITPTKKLTPTPTGTSGKLDRAKLTVAVLNGSGIAGAGRKYSTMLSGLGYNVTSTNNADTFDYTGITVKVKKAKSDYAALLKKDLASTASGSAIKTSIDDTITTDAAVVVGK